MRGNAFKTTDLVCVLACLVGRVGVCLHYVMQVLLLLAVLIYLHIHRLCVVVVVVIHSHHNKAKIAKPGNAVRSFVRSNRHATASMR